MNSLSKKRCVPCEGGIPPLSLKKVKELLKELNEWKAEKNKKLWKEFNFKNFVEAMHFANLVGEIAEKENHHPDLCISWGKVKVELSTHSIKGLSENDFILASKIDAIMH
ncbi:MAG: 4a-hydroxytetrahydrobiopterin dehydratase [archaeon]|nr:4a-hydroxytetrahydrobiopterin dehydratase [archaeon]